MEAWKVILLVIAPQILIWGIIFQRMRHQSNCLREDIHRVGEMVILGPERADYQGWVRRFGYARTMGVIALSNRRLIFKRPIGADIVIPREDIVQVSDTVRMGEIRHRFGKYLALTLVDGAEVVFLINNQARWMEELRLKDRA